MVADGFKRAVRAVVHDEAAPRFEGTASPRREFFYLNNGALEAVRRDQWKLRVVRASPKTPAVPQLFDLSVDPSERVDVAARQPQVVSELVDRLRTFAQETGARHALADVQEPTSSID